MLILLDDSLIRSLRVAVTAEFPARLMQVNFESSLWSGFERVSKLLLG